MKALDAFDRVGHDISISDEAAATLVLAEATFELAAAHREQNDAIEQGIMYLVKHLPAHPEINTYEISTAIEGIATALGDVATAIDNK